jgi:[ribosomal protein S5]-alanine N-acetyltransferase
VTRTLRAPPPRRLETTRLVLRVPEREDAEALFEAYASDLDATRYLSWRPHEDPSGMRDYVERIHASWAEGSAYHWVLELDDTPVGMISAEVSAHAWELGYVLGRRWWRQGLMSEAVAALTRWGLTTGGLPRVWAVCDVDNVASARLLESVGFVREGVLRRWSLHPNVADEPRDVHVYSRVRDDLAADTSTPHASAGIEVDEVVEIGPELGRAFTQLVPQLSRSAPAPSPTELEEIVSSPATRLLVARDGERVVGSLTLVLFRIPTGVRAWIEDVVVDEAARRRGVGSLLTTAAIDLAGRAGARTVDLTSRPDREAANALYEELGFARRETNVYRYEP